MARFTHLKIVNAIQSYGARMHFNEMDAERVTEDTDGSVKEIKIRYGIIEVEDLKRDLENWETLLASSFMQRPFEVLEKGNHFDQIMVKQNQNLASAVSFISRWSLIKFLS